MRIWSLIVLLLFISCYDEADFSPSILTDIMAIVVDNNGALADGVSEVLVSAVFSSDFNTEGDGKVEFIINRLTPETVSSDIRLVERNGRDLKVAELKVAHNVAEELLVDAVINIGNAEVRDGVSISFTRAYCESIEITTSSLKISPDSSFSEITLTTSLARDRGRVTIGSRGETMVVDTLGEKRGVFKGYKNITDSVGTIINTFTMGNDPYQGRLQVIANALDEQENVKSDTLIIYSQK